MSPCIRVCRLDAAGRYCTGCLRTADEIARWWGMRDDEKRAVLAALGARKTCGGPDTAVGPSL